MPRVIFYQDDGLKAAASAKVGRENAPLLESAESIGDLVAGTSPNEAFLVVVNLDTSVDVRALITDLDTRGYAHYRVLGVFPNADAVIDSPLANTGDRPEILDLVPLTEMPMRVQNTLPAPQSAQDPTSWVPVKLLARLEPGAAEADPKPPKIFANILKLSEIGCLMESSQSLDEGSEHGLSFFIPGAGYRADVRIRVERVVDAGQLHYQVRYLEPGHECEAAITAYLQKRSPSGAAIGEPT